MKKNVLLLIFSIILLSCYIPNQENLEVDEALNDFSLPLNVNLTENSKANTDGSNETLDYNREVLSSSNVTRL